MTRTPANSRSGLLSLRLVTALVACGLIPLLAFAAAPSWWSQRGALNPNATPDDYALANQGQLKNIAKAAVVEFDAHLPGGAGDALHNLVNSWTESNAQRNDFAPLNLGQLKNVAKAFYDRLIAVHYSNNYPWTGNPNSPDDFALANIGQVKNLFRFDLLATDLTHDSDGNGLPDWWENYYFGHVGVDPNSDADLDGLTNLQELLQGSDPNDYYNGRVIRIDVVAGDNQSSLADAFLPAPLVVRVEDSDGTPLDNAPVQFAVVNGGGGLTQTSGASTSPTLAVRTGTDGTAQAYYRQPDSFGITSTIIASAVSPATSAQATFHATTTEGLIFEPGSINAVVNAGQSRTIPLTVINSSSQAQAFGVAVQNTEISHLGFTDSDQPAGPAFVWNDIRITGHHLDAVSNADDDFEAFNIGFAFPYFGSSYSTVYVSSNGFITFGQGSTEYSNLPLPDPNMPPNEIAAFHTDLNLRNSGDVYYQEYADRVVIQFTNAARYAGDGVETFQIVLQHDGTILLYYLEMQGAVEEATVGIQNATGDEGLTIAYGAPFLKNNLAVRITVSDSWLKVAPLNGNLAPGERVTLAATFNEVGLTQGSYTGAIEVSAGSGPGLSNGVPVNMNINEAPQVALLEPSNNAAYLIDEGIQLTASAEDPDGIQKVEFYNGTNKIGEVAAAPYTLMWNGPGGNYSITAKAIDSLGAIRASQAVSARQDTDSDNDGIGDEWETANFGNLNQAAAADFDSDGLTNIQEYRARLSPINRDTDGDGASDGDEVNVYHTNPLARDSDGDSMEDGWEIQHGLDPTAKGGAGDKDGDGLSDKAEFLYHTDPEIRDTDGDGVLDGEDGWANDNTFSPPRLPDVHYAVIDLGPGVATALNNDGAVVGYVPAAGFGNPQALLWSKGTRTPLGPYRMAAINDSGRMLGTSGLVGYFWSGANSGAQLLTMPIDLSDYPDEDPNGAWYVHSPSKINNNGVIVAHRVDDGYNRWGNTRISVYGTIGSFASEKGVELASVNDSGVFTGEDDADFAVRAQSGSVIENLGSLPYPFNDGSNAVDIDDAGDENSEDEIVGYSYHGYPFQFRACLWARGRAIDLGTLSGCNDTFSSAINNKRQIVGGGGDYPDDKAFLWQNQGIRDLNDWIPKDSGVHLYWASDLNDNGVIAASGYNAQGQVHAYLLVPAELVPEYNRDGKIDDQDRDRIASDNPYRFWVNDDNDDGNTGGDGVPTNGGGNGVDVRVNGTRDLIDFFPVFLDIKELLRVLPADTFDYTLTCDDPFLNYVATDLTPANTRDYLTKLDSATGELDSAGVLSNQPVNRIVQGGQRLEESFLDKMKNDGKGIILFEAWSRITHPLKLRVTKHGTGGKVAEIELPLSIDDVEKMYRHYNLMFADNATGGKETDLATPANYPDNLCNEKHFIFVHGYNDNPTQARGWNAKMFKSMWWAGSRAKFYGLTWHGSESQIDDQVTVNYHLNVDNAFATSRPFAGFINSRQGSVTVVAHSLGNLVVASAIHDWTARIDNFYMVAAAVAIEAFDGAAAQDSLMAHEDWYRSDRPPDQNYAGRLWASEWYTNPAFTAGDGRKGLTWRDRLQRATNTTIYNFYSSGEEVLAAPDSTTPTVIGFARGQLYNIVFGRDPRGEKVWTLQEKLKGRTTIGEILGSTYGGWGFNRNWYLAAEEGPPRRRTPDETGALTNEQLIQDPFFLPGSQELHSGGGSNYALLHQNTLLAQMVPARTRPAGGNRIESSDFIRLSGEDRNLNLTSTDFQNGWPQERLNNDNKRNRWLHSDMDEVAYPFTWKLFDAFKNLGALDE